jgi:type VI secretion system protein ImpE
MKAAELLKAGRLEDCLGALQSEVRANPADAKLRVFLFQLLAVLGQWGKAMTQLNVAAELDASCLLMAQACRQLLNCEVFRAEVFAGRRGPLVFGQPEEWLGWLVQANSLLAGGQSGQAAELRDRAFEAAPAVAGQIDGQPFEWIADADTRLGPILEVVVDGRYYWVPFGGIKALRLEQPTDLRDVLWLPATFVWANEGQAAGFVLARYPGSEGHAEAAVKLARQTLWETTADGHSLGFGQRMLATDQGEFALADTREILLT